MKKLLLFLILFSGCQQQVSPSHYTIDWNSPVQLPPQKELESSQQQIPENTVASRLLELHNYNRELKGRPGLVLDKNLCDYAVKHAMWMAQNNNLKHSNINNLLGNFHTAGENIAWNQTSPEEVMNDWMNSPGHRENIMNRKFTSVGFGFVKNNKGEIYWCTVFGG